MLLSLFFEHWSFIFNSETEWDIFWNGLLVWDHSSSNSHTILLIILNELAWKLLFRGASDWPNFGESSNLKLFDHKEGNLAHFAIEGLISQD